MKDAVEHFVDGRNAWQLGILGFFTRVRGIAPSVIFTIITMGVPFWWPSVVPSTVSCPGWVIFLSTVSLSGAAASVGLVYLRNRSRRSLGIKASLHQLAHQIRDEETKVYRRVSQPHTGNSHDEDLNFYEYADRLCNHVRQFFAPQLNDATAQCAIRLAIESNPPSPTAIVYSTFGRSDGLSAKRAETTEDIPSNEGIPRFLAGKDCLGILIYNDIRRAATVDAFRMTKNDTLYGSEIRTMMVAPLNGWDGKRSSMIGLLYVTSGKESVFKAKHVDAMRFAADLVSESIAFTVQQLRAGGRMPHINRRRS